MVTITEVREIIDHCLKVLTYTDYLREDANTKEAYDYAEKALASLRKLYVVSTIQNKRVICISGLQGTGKTTLMKNFYGLDNTYLNATRGRGERIPVFITEKEGVSTPVMYAIKVEKDSNGNYVRKEEEISPEDYGRASQGGDSRTMFLELNVPYQHTNSESICFMLLPGYEKKKDSWKALIDFSVNSSDAAVFVFDDTSFANADNEEYLSKIEERFGKNLVYVITHSEVSPDDNAEVKETCIETLGIKQSERDRVVCVGEYREEEKRRAWNDAFKDALEKYAYKETAYIQRNSRFLYELVHETRDELLNIKDIIEEDNSPAVNSHINKQLLKDFDDASEKARKSFKKKLDNELKKARELSERKLKDQFNKRPVLGNVRRFFFGNSMADLEETSRITENALKDDTGRYLLDGHLVTALCNSCSELESKNGENGSFNPLILPQKDYSEELLKDNTEAAIALKEDMTNLLAEQGNNDRFVIKSQDQKRLMTMIADFTSYYYCYTSVREGNILDKFPGYKPAASRFSAGKLYEDAEAAKQYTIGLFGIMGIDVIGDGSLNFVSQIAAAVGIPVAAAGAVATAVIGAGAVSSMMKDINRMEFEDYTSAEVAVKNVYENYACEVMDRYNDYISVVRERIDDRLSENNGDKKKAIIKYNAKVEISNARDLLRKISKKLAGDENGVEAAFS